MHTPSVSIVMPILNEEGRVGRALASIASQDFPADRLEVLVADGGSTDRSVEEVRGWEGRLPVKVVDNSARREAQWGKTIALERAGSDLVFFQDADVWLPEPDTLSRLVRPLVEDPSLAGSIAPYAYRRELPLWSRFLSYDPLQRDPLLQAMTPGLGRFVRERRDGYVVCEFPTPRIPPIGQTTIYWRSQIDPHRWDGYWREVDHPAYLVKQGYRRFAFTPGAGLAHAHASSLADMVRKRVRNLLVYENGYLRLRGESDYVWLDTSNRSEVLRLAAWVLGTNLIVPRLLEGIDDAFRHKSWEPLLRPIAAIAITDGLLAALVTSRDGRRFLRRSLGVA